MVFYEMFMVTPMYLKYIQTQESIRTDYYFVFDTDNFKM